MLQNFSFTILNRILPPCNYCHHPWCVGDKSYHKALSIMFSCDGMSDHACWNGVFHYLDKKLSCTPIDHYTTEGVPLHIDTHMGHEFLHSDHVSNCVSIKPNTSTGYYQIPHVIWTSRDRLLSFKNNIDVSAHSSYSSPHWENQEFKNSALRELSWKKTRGLVPW